MNRSRAMTIQSTRMIPSWNMPVDSPPPPSNPGSEKENHILLLLLFHVRSGAHDPGMMKLIHRAQGCCRCISNKVRKQEQESRIQANGSETRDGKLIFSKGERFCFIVKLGRERGVTPAVKKIHNNYILTFCETLCVCAMILPLNLAK